MVDRTAEERTSTRQTVLVTGASGFLAAWIMPRLLARGYAVVATDLTHDARRLALVADPADVRRIAWRPLDITDGAAVLALARDIEPAAIVHLAALQIPACKANPALGERVNIGGHIHVLDAARAIGARVLYTSSVAAKPRGPNNAPANLYGVYKKACEEISRVYATDFGVASLGLRPHVVYGVGRDQGETSAITMAMRAAAHGEDFTIPWVTRTCFQYAGDIAAMFVAATAASWTGALLSDMTDRVESSADVMAAIHACVPGARVAAAGPERLSPTTGFDVATLDRIIGERPETPLAQGVRETINLFRSAGASDKTV